MITLTRKRDNVAVDFNVADISELKGEFDFVNNLIRINDVFYILNSLQTTLTITPTRPIMDGEGNQFLALEESTDRMIVKKQTFIENNLELQDEGGTGVIYVGMKNDDGSMKIEFSSTGLQIFTYTGSEYTKVFTAAAAQS